MILFVAANLYFTKVAADRGVCTPEGHTHKRSLANVACVSRQVHSSLQTILSKILCRSHTHTYKRRRRVPWSIANHRTSINGVAKVIEICLYFLVYWVNKKQFQVFFGYLQRFYEVTWPWSSRTTILVSLIHNWDEQYSKISSGRYLCWSWRGRSPPWGRRVPSGGCCCSKAAAICWGRAVAGFPVGTVAVASEEFCIPSWERSPGSVKETSPQLQFFGKSLSSADNSVANIYIRLLTSYKPRQSDINIVTETFVSYITIR